MKGNSFFPVLCLFAGSVESGWAAAPAAPVIPFSELWKRVSAHSPAQKASSLEAQSAQVAADRAARHWYPRVFTEGRAYSTNDPGTSFISVLNQRQITQNDFIPEALNNPPSAFFQKLTAGLDFPLFEGGSRVAMADAAEAGARAKQLAEKAMRNREYSAVSRLYGHLLAYLDQLEQLENLKQSIEGVLSSYRVGERENPVGYSGLLGLKNLKNRVDGNIVDSQARARSVREVLKQLAVELPEDWRPADQTVTAFADLYMKVPMNGPAARDSSNDSAQVRAMYLSAEAAENAVTAERARFIPRLGVFAQTDVMSGTRDISGSYTAGAYLQWELFSAPNFGAVKQAKLNARAAEAGADAARLRELNEVTESIAAATALEKNLDLLHESSRLLSEQTDTSRRLFRNGSINALQFVEVLSRRADLIASFAQARTQYLDVKSNWLVQTNFEPVVK